jgi:hypothetical protein
MESYLTTKYKFFLIEKNSGEMIWNLEVDNIELLAGMLAAGMGIMDDLNFETKYGNYYLDSDADVSSFRLVNDIVEDEIRNNSAGRLRLGQYGLWMKSNKQFYYSLYAFETNYFFQGIVSICNSFEVDFRNYVYGFPFDGNGNQYSLLGYVLAPYQVGQDAPDLDDIEAEEADDENIIEPLARTDDIITLKD